MSSPFRLAPGTQAVDQRHQVVAAAAGGDDGVDPGRERRMGAVRVAVSDEQYDPGPGHRLPQRRGNGPCRAPDALVNDHQIGADAPRNRNRDPRPGLTDDIETGVGVQQVHHGLAEHDVVCHDHDPHSIPLSRSRAHGGVPRPRRRGSAAAAEVVPVAKQVLALSVVLFGCRRRPQPSKLRRQYLVVADRLRLGRVGGLTYNHYRQFDGQVDADGLGPGNGGRGDAAGRAVSG
jgi:hypothetical protein